MIIFKAGIIISAILNLKKINRQDKNLNENSTFITEIVLKSRKSITM